MKINLKLALSWIDDHILLILSGFLIVFIPLFPKIPLAELIPGYIVRMRIEDVFVAITAVIWIIQVLRGKAKWKSLIFWAIVVYLLIGFLSILSAIFIAPSIPLEILHIGKTSLHWFRYLEYFVLFLITFSAIKSKKDVRTLVNVIALTTLAIVVYGYGQRYHYWPVYSTMNREFSKGVRLYLTENARVQSTFAGHYDLAAYLVITLNLILALAYKQSSKLKKIAAHTVHILGLWLLITTASRVSYIAYFVGAIVVIALVASEKETLAKRIKWGLSQSFIILTLVIVMTFLFGADMQERFLHVFRGYPQIEQTYTAVGDFVSQTTDQFLTATNLKSDRKKKIPSDWIAVELDEDYQEIDEVLTKTDERPVQERPDRTRPDDVYVDVPVTTKVATESAEGKTEYVYVKTDRTWSENAMKYGLSTAIRLDTLWPNALEGFKHNPLLGKGYATLNKETFMHFTEAESTDNNFLRTLGETGLLGFISFYGIVALAMYLAFKFHQVDRTYTSAISIGFIGASVGILVNALYIDVFAASKVAFTYWTITGIVVALYYQGRNKQRLQNLTLVSRFQKLKSKIKTKLRIAS